MQTMHAVFLVCLLGGLVSTALFAALGALGGAFGHMGHLHVGQGSGHLHLGQGSGHLPAGGPAHGHALVHSHGPQATPAGHSSSVSHVGSEHGAVASGSTLSPLLSVLGWTLSWLSPLTVAAAALWFGGAGLITEAALGSLAVAVALIAGLFGAAVIRALMAAFMRASTPPLQEHAEGALGLINAPIRADGVGEVVYTLEGLQRSAPARSLDGAQLPRGTRVVIVRRERGIALVSAIDPLAPLDSAALPPAPDERTGEVVR